MKTKTQPKTTQPIEEPVSVDVPPRAPNPLVLRMIFDRIAEWEEEMKSKEAKPQLSVVESAVPVFRGKFLEG